ncbi:MAG: hypothetical protein KGL39_45315 [Patescibacteria group bacterium]|nr:hypothetical protein [Patescibacteria group bacterium]
MNTFFAYATNTFVVGAACFVAGVIFSQKVKDWLFGVPAAFRASMKSLETTIETEVNAATADVFAKFSPSNSVSIVKTVVAPVVATSVPAPASAEPPKA